MEIVVAKTAGFCFGVNRAVTLVDECLERGEKAATLGPIIHNPQMVELLQQRGVRIIDDVADANSDETVIIRSHGVKLSVKNALKARGLPYVDATCPYVVKIHDIVQEHSKQGYTILIAGDKEHPEVEGITGHCCNRPHQKQHIASLSSLAVSTYSGGRLPCTAQFLKRSNEVFVFKDIEELKNILKLSDCGAKNVVLLAQTTFNIQIWKKCQEFIKKHCTNVKIFDTICSATTQRQVETEKLSQNSDIMLVIGGKSSSNTAKLREICEKHCKTMAIEDKNEVYNFNFKEAKKIGVTAGASTPSYIIEEVLNIMDDILKQEENKVDEILQQEAGENEVNMLPPSDVNGILQQSENESELPSQTSMDGILQQNTNENESELLSQSPLDDILKRGASKNEFELFSKSDIDEILNQETNETDNVLQQDVTENEFEKLLSQSDYEKIYAGKRVKGIVTSVTKSEVQVDIGAKGSGIISVDELTDDPTQSLKNIVSVGDEIEAVVMKVNDLEGLVMLSKRQNDAFAGRDKIKGAYLNNITLEGIVTDIIRGGILVLSNSVKVFVPASQTGVKKDDELNILLKQKVKFKVIELKDEGKRAVGSIRKAEQEERSKISAKFWEEAEVGKIYKGPIKSMVSYGVFVDLGGVDGMVHITELSWAKLKHPSEIVKEGDILTVYIKDIDTEKKRVSLGHKNTEDNPWTKFAAEYMVGDIVKVKVVSMTTFGAFCEILPGLEGLIHISQISNKRIAKVKDELSINQEVEVEIIGIDIDKKNVSLSLRALEKVETVEIDDELKQAAEAAGVTLTSDEPTETTSEDNATNDAQEDVKEDGQKETQKVVQEKAQENVQVDVQENVQEIAKADVAEETAPVETAETASENISEEIKSSETVAPVENITEKVTEEKPKSKRRTKKAETETTPVENAVETTVEEKPKPKRKTKKADAETASVENATETVEEEKPKPKRKTKKTEEETT